MSETPEILPVKTEAAILYERVCAHIVQVNPLNPDLTVGDHMETIASAVVVGVLRQLRVMSARQLAVLLAAEANRGIHYVIREPPHYSAEEIADAE